MSSAHLGLVKLTIRYVRAYEQFIAHPESVVAIPATHPQAVSQRFFQLKDELLEEGLKIDNGKRYGLSSLEVAVFR